MALSNNSVAMLVGGGLNCVQEMVDSVRSQCSEIRTQCALAIFHTFHHVFTHFALSQYKMQQCEVLHVAEAHFCHDIHTTTSSQKSTSPSTTSHNGTIYLVAKVCENVT